MKIIALLLSSFLMVANAHAQDFGSYTFLPYPGCCNGPSPTGAPLPTDVIPVSRLIGTTYSTAYLPLASFASAADLQSMSASINDRIDQAFQAYPW